MGRITGASAKNGRGSYELRYTTLETKRLKVFHKRFGHFIPVNRKSYEVIYCSNLEYQGEAVQGLCCPRERQIYIDITHQDLILETLLHELMHAEVTEMGLRQMPSWSIDTEELLCELVGNFISHNFSLRLRK